MSDNITFEDFDKFGRKAFADRLTTVITKFYPFYDDAFVLSLNAKFGSGKTTFLKMWQNELKNKEKIEVIYINAWESDFDDEPIVPIISALLAHVNKDTTAGKAIAKPLNIALGVVALGINDVAGHFTGFNAKSVTEGATNQVNKLSLEKAGKELYKSYSFKADAYIKLREALEAYIDKLDNKPLVIFVDELDRARPDYSIKFLEAIKHIFAVKGICFVLGVDRVQLEISVRQLYGNIDFENYYRRFVIREANLPELINVDIKPFTEYLARDFFDEKRGHGINYPFKNEEQGQYISFISEVCAGFSLVPREIESLFRIFSQFMAVEGERLIKENWIKATVLLIALRVKNPDLYYKVGKGGVEPREFYKYIISSPFLTKNGNRSYRHIILLAMSFLLKDGNDTENNEIVTIGLNHCPTLRENTPHIAKDRMLGLLLKKIDEWSELPSQSGFKSIYENLENWEEFI